MNNSFQPGQFYQPPTTQKPLPHQRLWLWYKGRKNVTKLGLGCGTVILLLFSCGLCSSLAALPATTSQTTASQTNTQISNTPVATPKVASTRIETAVVHKNARTPKPKPTPTRIPATPTPIATQPAPISTPIVIQSVSTPAPVVQKPAPTSPPKAAPVPTQPPAQQPATGVNGNPWGYDFTYGNPIYSPAAAFCDYFSCVTTFWTKTNGYVAECNNGEYTHSGGVSGACSRDGGVYRTLYSH